VGEDCPAVGAGCWCPGIFQVDSAGPLVLPQQCCTLMQRRCVAEWLMCLVAGGHEEDSLAITERYRIR